jgi:hypothetical protein
MGVTDQTVYYNRGAARSMLGDQAGALDDYARSCRAGYVSACQFSKILSEIGKPSL